MSDDAGRITHLLESARGGHADAHRELYGLVYGELEVLARQRLRGNADHVTLEAPALINEAYLRLVRHGPGAGANRRMFYAYASIVMRAVIVDYLRERSAQKRGGAFEHVTLTIGAAGLQIEAPDIEGLDGALQALRKVDERAHRIVELRFFGGLSMEEVAEELGVSGPTVKRGWRTARAFLYSVLQGDASR